MKKWLYPPLSTSFIFQQQSKPYLSTHYLTLQLRSQRHLRHPVRVAACHSFFVP